MHQMAMDGEFDSGLLHIRPYGIYFSDDGWDEVTDSTEDGAYDEVGSDNISTDFAVTSVKNISVNGDAVTIYVKETENADIVTVKLLKGREKYYNCRLDGDTLHVTYDAKGHTRYSGDGPKIAIYLPADAVFDSIDFDIDAANIEITVPQISCENMTVDVDAGNLEAEKIIVKNTMNVDINAGNLQIEDGTFGNIEADCDMGNIEVAGKLTGDMTGNCNMGSIVLDLEGEQTDYNYDLTCSMGKITLNGVNHPALDGDYSANNANAVGTISLDCDMGNIEIETK